jgi:hypothetical protein
MINIFKIYFVFFILHCSIYSSALRAETQKRTEFEIQNRCTVHLNHHKEGTMNVLAKGYYMVSELPLKGAKKYTVAGDVFLSEKEGSGFIKIHDSEGYFHRSANGKISEINGTDTIITSLPLPGETITRGLKWQSDVTEYVDISRWGISGLIELNGWGFFECHKIEGGQAYIRGMSTLSYKAQKIRKTILSPRTIHGSEYTDYVLDLSSKELSSYNKHYEYHFALENREIYAFNGTETASFRDKGDPGFTDTLVLINHARDSLKADEIKIDIRKDRINLSLGEIFLTDITPGNRKMLDDVVTFINRIPDKLIISIEGHTDDIGNEQYNYLLSKIRAKNVRDYLSGKITAAHRLSYSGYGDSRPVSSDTTADGRRKNRRVEIVIRPY